MGFQLLLENKGKLSEKLVFVMLLNYLIYLKRGCMIGRSKLILLHNNCMFSIVSSGSKLRFSNFENFNSGPSNSTKLRNARNLSNSGTSKLSNCETPKP